VSPVPRCAVVFNPVKVSDTFRETLQSRLSQGGWSDTLWLATTEEDPGHAMTAEALDQGVNLVIGAGGDGTVRVVAHELANSGIPMGIVAAGTANLLAHNLDLPLEEAEAIDVALGQQVRTIDLIRLTVDDQEPQHYAVMAGIGMDAVIMDEVNPKLKAKIGSAAYFLAVGKALGRLPMRLHIRVDDHRRQRRRAMICVIGNVGTLAGNITLLPDAQPDDGFLDVYVASPHRLTHWIRVFIRLLIHREHAEDQVDSWRGKRVEVLIDGDDSYQLDGDVAGTCRRLVAEVAPGALQVCVGRPAATAGGSDAEGGEAGQEETVAPIRIPEQPRPEGEVA